MPMKQANRRSMFRAFAVVALASLTLTVSPAEVAAATSSPTGEPETHCVLEVLETLPTGEFVLSQPMCFAHFADAIASASGGAVTLAEGTSGNIAFTDAGAATTLSSFTLGIHYDGFNGTGSSISVVGSSCTGGWWNTPSSWRNRISSSYNGCGRLRHYDNPNTTGSYQDTYGSGTTDNLGSLNNRAESISYHSS